jgi:FkbM family methyltransferase
VFILNAAYAFLLCQSSSESHPLPGTAPVSCPSAAPVVTSVRAVKVETPFTSTGSSFNQHVVHTAYFLGSGFGSADPTPSARIVTSLPHPPSLQAAWISDTTLHIRFGPIARLNADVSISLIEDAEPTVVKGVSLLSPEHGEDIIEWRTLTAARDDAVRRGASAFTFVELGAGFGRWSSAAAHVAAEAALQARLVLVEAEPLHFEWIDVFMKEEGVSETLYTRINAAIGARSEDSAFFLVNFDGYDAVTWYGQRTADEFDFQPSGETYGGGVLYRDWRDNSVAAVKVSTVRLEDVLPEEGVVDLIDMDVQGAEGDIIAASLETLSARVLRLYIGTHSHEVESQIRDVMFSRGGWELLYDQPVGATAAPDELGSLHLGDGVQSWRNSRLYQELSKGQ